MRRVLPAGLRDSFLNEADLLGPRDDHEHEDADGMDIHSPHPGSPNIHGMQPVNPAASQLGVGGEGDADVADEEGPQTSDNISEGEVSWRRRHPITGDEVHGHGIRRFALLGQLEFAPGVMGDVVERQPAPPTPLGDNLNAPRSRQHAAMSNLLRGLERERDQTRGLPGRDSFL